ncbi:MAG TPA: sigma-70 family RNA polymerase sigma factor [Bryobacteraceae bacterium]|nr:sigma-70 family RNA polymerase sigma factor [Bryobacteraceae bacterium]
MLLATKHEVPVSIISNAVDGMFREHHSMVFRTAYRITGNAADAEDVLQTVFLRIAGRDEAAAVIELPENYLRRSAVHAALDLVRARRQPAAVDLERLPASGSQPDESDLRNLIRRAVAELPPRAAEIFTLRFFEGLSNSEIARALGVSSITVAVSLHRSRRTLQTQLRPKS